MPRPAKHARSDAARQAWETRRGTRVRLVINVVIEGEPRDAYRELAAVAQQLARRARGRRQS